MSKMSRAALLEFLEYLADKGLVNKATVSARKAAAGRVLSILDEAEASDVSKVDLDDVMARFHNLEGSKFTPASLNAYKSRLKSTLDDFLRYQADPLNFKPSVQNTGRRTSDRPRSTTRAENAATSTPPRSIEAPPTSVSILPIPIRADLTIKIQGLPYDLTIQEANKIANVIKAMAIQN